MDDNTEQSLQQISPFLFCSDKSFILIGNDTSMFNTTSMRRLASSETLQKNYPTNNTLSRKQEKKKRKEELLKKLGNIWIQRMAIAEKYLEEGVDVIMTDTDAIWLRSPFKQLSAMMRNGDNYIIASRGKYPYKISDKNGACLCMGFIYFKVRCFGEEN